MSEIFVGLAAALFVHGVCDVVIATLEMMLIDAKAQYRLAFGHDFND